MSNFEGKKIVVMGLGRFGGGVGVSRWLAEQGARVTITDLAAESELADSVEQLSGLPFELHFGGHDPSDLDGADLLVVNPAVDKPKSEFVQTARSRNIPLSCEMNIFFEHCPAKIIGVTGSMGKSTTTAMIFDLLYAQVKKLRGSPLNVWLGGNIGQSLLSHLSNISPADYVVLELSSFQLEDLSDIAKSPHISVLTNLWPHHLERHGDFNTYVRAKSNIFLHQSAKDVAVIGKQAAAVLSDHKFSLGAQKCIEFEPAGDLAGQLRVLGEHNLHNAAAARQVGQLLDLPDDLIDQELKQFKGLAHRLEFVRSYNDVKYYNDSKATTPLATITALKAFDRQTIVICGGLDRPLPLDSLAQAFCNQARVIVCFGESRAKIAAHVRRLGETRPLPVIKTVHEFNGAINLARRLGKPGEIILFSPACASFDEFANYEQRGDRFKSIVNGWV